MPPFAIGLIALVFIVLIVNFIAHMLRIRKLGSPYGRRGKKAQEEDIASIARDNEVYRRLELEQSRIKKYLQLRAKTWAIYEEVRQKHANSKPNEELYK